MQTIPFPTISMSFCSAYACSKTHVKNKGLSWLYFQVGRPELKQWLHNCRRTRWKPSTYSCSSHIVETCFDVDVYTQLMEQNWSKLWRHRVLKFGAVPTIFNHISQPVRRKIARTSITMCMIILFHSHGRSGVITHNDIDY